MFGFESLCLSLGPRLEWTRLHLRGLNLLLPCMCWTRNSEIHRPNAWRWCGQRILTAVLTMLSQQIKKNTGSLNKHIFLNLWGTIFPPCVCCSIYHWSSSSLWGGDEVQDVVYGVGTQQSGPSLCLTNQRSCTAIWLREPRVPGRVCVKGWVIQDEFFQCLWSTAMWLKCRQSNATSQLHSWCQLQLRWWMDPFWQYHGIIISYINICQLTSRTNPEKIFPTVWVISTAWL